MTSTPPRTIQVPTERPRRRRRRVVVLAVVGGLLLLVIAAGAAVFGVRTAQGLQSATTTETVPGVRALVVDVDEGRVALRAAPGPDIGIRTTRTWGPGYEPGVQRSVTGGVLTLTSDCASFNLGCEVEQEITVPAGTAVTVRTVDGPVDATGLDVLRFDATGVNGPITAGFARPPDAVRIETTAGAVRVAVPPAPYRVSADAVVGPVTVGLPDDPTASRSIDVGTVAGPIDVSAR